MTGYGKSEAVYEGKKIIVEIKSLNSKNLDINTRIAQNYQSKELELRKMIATCAIRGKVDFSIKIEEISNDVAALINREVVKSYISQIKNICEEANIKEPQDWWHVIRQ